jgi:endonuclease-8
MHGSWHLYRCGEPWQRSHRLARVVLETNRLVAVCFGAPTVRLLASPGQLARDPHLSTLGPDILAAEFERDRALANLRALPQLELGDALLHQRAVAGIGNVYKSETLFVCRLNPFARVDAVDDAALIRVLDESRAAIVRHATSSLPRQTRRRLTGPRVWVYRRAGEPCLVCGATVAMRRQGASSRSTYYCPSCQSVPPAETRRHPIGHGGV